MSPEISTIKGKLKFKLPGNRTVAPGLRKYEAPPSHYVRKFYIEFKCGHCAQYEDSNAICVGCGHKQGRIVDDKYFLKSR